MLRIWGIEATQAIQFFRSTHPLCSGPGGTMIACADNSVPLVAQKPVVLRLYVSGATPGSNLAGIATTPSSGAIYGSTYSIAGFGGMIAPASPATRTNGATTLHIRLRPYPVGTYRFDAIVLEYAPNSGNVVANASASILLEFIERRRIRIRLVRIHYSGRGMNVAAPSLKDFWEATDFAQRLLPIPPPGFEIVRDSVETYDGDFMRIDPSAHDPMWAGRTANDGTTGNLLNIMDRLVGAESLPSDVVYVGIYPDNVRQSAFSGWAVGRWIISDRDGQTFAHEILHQNGVPQHAPCGGPNYVDANYPDYPAFSALPAGSIGEVGFDCSTLAAMDPLTTYDLMSYCQPKWISPYNYIKGFQSLPPIPPSPPQPAQFTRRDRFVDVSFARFRDRWVVVDLPGFARPLPPRPPYGRTRLQVVVRGLDNAVLWRGPAAVSRRETANADIPELIETEVPWFRDATAVELCRGEETLARMEIECAPALAVHFPPREQLEQGRGVVSYRTESRSDRIAVAVRASLDGGATWAAIVSAKPAGKVDVSPLPRNFGEECFLEVLTTSGYHTAAETSEQFRVRPRDREILAWSSAESGRVQLGQPVQLFAIVADGAAPASDLSWHSDLDGELGEGARLTATLRTGRHRIEVRSRGPFQRPTSLELVVD